MGTTKTFTGKVLCGLASALLVLGMSTASFAQSHSGGSHGGGSQHDATGDHHSGGCSGGCSGDEHDTGDEGHGGGKGPKYRGGGIIRGHRGGVDHGGLHDIFRQMEDEFEGHSE